MLIFSSPKTLDAIQESGFIQNVLLDGIPFYTQFNCQMINGSTLIYLELYEINQDFICHAKALGKKVVLFHMGDELGNKDISVYLNCDLIIRNYFIARIFSEPSLHNKIIWVPNGYKTGVGPRNPNRLLPAQERSNLACFLGWLSNVVSFNGERALFSEAIHASKGSPRKRARGFLQWLHYFQHLSEDYLAFSKVAPHCSPDLYLLPSGGFSKGYSVGLYSAMMEDSIFAPCPAGNSPETIRLYDALECGCIPVLLQHEFIGSKAALSEFGTPPFLTLTSWQEFPEFLQNMKVQLESDPLHIHEQQIKCITWWNHYKSSISEKISSHLTKLSS